MFREMADNPKTMPQTLRASANMWNYKVHASTIRNIWDKYGMFGRLGRKISLFYLKKTWQHSLSLQTCIWTNHKTSRTISFEQMRPRWRCLVIIHKATFDEKPKEHVSTNTSSQKIHMLVEGWWFWAWFVTTGPGHLTVIELTMNSSVYQSILQSNVRTSIQQLKLGQD